MTQSRQDNPQGMVSDIQKFSMHDGPGIRSTVFFKGCYLRCTWCHNPETHQFHPEVLFYPQRCNRCGRCTTACALALQRMDEDGMRTFERAGCIHCGCCAQACSAGALELVGRRMTVDQVMEQLRPDLPFYRNSGGGVSFSGGDCMAQIDFLSALLRACKRHGIHTAVDTSGDFDWCAFERILADTDLFLYDIKASDNALHRLLTGAGNERIWQNLDRLDAMRAPIVLRVPLIPGATDVESNLHNIAERLAQLCSRPRTELLRYNALAPAKYTALGRDYPLSGWRAHTQHELCAMLDLFQKAGVDAVIA